MGVPNNTTFSLQHVVDEINPTTDDLQDCVNDANSASYDTTYYTAPATSLLEFRNYGAAAGTITMTLIMENYIFSPSNTFGASINGVTYYADNNGYYYNNNISVPAGTNIFYYIFANDGSGNDYDTYLEMYDDNMFYDSDYGLYPYLNGTYTTGTSNFTLYIYAYT